MELPAIEEFDEADLLYAPAGESDDEDHGVKIDKSDDENDGMWEMEPDREPRGSIDISSSFKASYRSSRQQAKDNDADDYATPLPDVAGHMGFQAHVMASSMPARPVRMGSSVPMNIPMNQLKKAEDGSKGTQAADSPLDTFVPPHELSQSIAATQGFAFSLATGESLASMKRDKLRTRNVILKSTGFLEDGAQEGPTLIPPTFEQELEGPRISQSSLLSGGLSKALGTFPS